MRRLSDCVAFAAPSITEIEAVSAAIGEARRRMRDVEIRVGVGPLAGDVPLRVLGYAGCVAEVLRVDVPVVARSATRIRVFSSAPKAEASNGAQAAIALAALGGALRIAGVQTPIELDLASQDDEISLDPHTLDLPEPIREWLRNAAARSNNHANPYRYAVEHASCSMFGDLDPEVHPPLRITIGGATEARFWSVRARVRAASLSAGTQVAPAVGILMRACRVTWYSPIPKEPALTQVLRSKDDAIEALRRITNPNVDGGNAALERESRATRRMMNVPGVDTLAAATADLESAQYFIRDSKFAIGPGLRARM